MSRSDIQETANVVLNFGKHNGELLTRAPVSYLKWMANSLTGYWRYLAKLELERRGHSLPELELSRHAMDNASLRCRSIWHETALDKDEGLISWLERQALEAYKTPVHTDGNFYHLGIKWVFAVGEEYPVLKTVMPKKDPRILQTSAKNS